MAASPIISAVQWRERAAALKPRSGVFIDGRFVPAANGATFDNLPGPAVDATIDEVVYTVRGSNNLATFDQGVTEIAVSASGMPALDAGWTYHSFRLNGNIGGGTPRGPKGFLDVEIAEEAP